MLGREGRAHASGWRCETCSWKPESLNVGVRGTRPGRQAGVASTESPTRAPWHCLQTVNPQRIRKKPAQSLTGTLLDQKIPHS